jgi:hypothetical protein
MKKVTLVLGMFLAVLITNAQSIENKSETENIVEKSQSIIVEPDSAIIQSEYARYDSYSEVETWQQVITPDRLVFYCEASSDKNQVNVAHIYEFDENGINNNYITVAVQEKMKYAEDYLNNLALNYKYVYDFKGVNENNQRVWESSKNIRNYADCGCGNVVVTVTANIPREDLQNLLGKCPVKTGKSGELLTIVYAPVN